MALAAWNPVEKRMSPALCRSFKSPRLDSHWPSLGHVLIPEPVTVNRGNLQLVPLVNDAGVGGASSKPHRLG